jgi:predicted phosphate transport protein (TIGR00153 family)
MRLSLVPENRRFYDLIEAAGDNMDEAVRALNDLLQNYTDVAKKLERLHELEHKGDEITHRMMDELNKTFVTPFDREDLAFLTRRLDDVVDFAWAAAVRLEAYSIEQITPTALDFGKLILRQSEILKQGVGMLRSRDKMQGILEISKEVHDIENQADVVLRKALAKRFNSGPHTVDTLIHGMKWSEIYGIFEKATDRAEDIADSLQAIVLKYA